MIQHKEIVSCSHWGMFETKRMTDRVEDAISEACNYALPPFLLERCAKAAIAAMREPTEAVADACEAFGYEGWGASRVIGSECWRAGIDAALGIRDS